MTHTTHMTPEFWALLGLCFLVMVAAVEAASQRTAATRHLKEIGGKLDELLRGLAEAERHMRTAPPRPSEKQVDS